MKVDSKIVGILNTTLKNELTAINQYFLHARMLDNWGLTRLGAYERQASIDEMKHADRLIERILFLEGLPNLQDLGKLLIGEGAKEIIECDLELERAALGDLRSGIEYCESVHDYASRSLLVDILKSEEDHVDFLETQLDMIGQMGLQNYVQLQSKAAEN